MRMQLGCGLISIVLSADLTMISFIIPAYNEEKLIASVLQSLHQAARTSTEAYEVIVVDDASTDQTSVIAEQEGAKVLCVSHRHIAAARNSGSKASKGDLFIFLDADTWITPEVLKAACSTIRNGAIGGGCAVKFDLPVPGYARIMLPLLLAAFRTAKLAAGCFIFCTREAFEKTGGFNETMYGAEEIAMSQALKRQGKFVVLREHVITSGRKLRAHSGWKLLSTSFRLAMRGPKAVRSREGLELWYKER
jgi:glycosyltransferase involved in cell wall biosynthesis